MPIYPFRCDHCGAEFEVSRKISAMRDPAPCPACDQPARRIFTPIAVTGQAEDPSATKPSTKPAAGGWSHFGHTHGAGTGTHSHGAPTTPSTTPPAKGVSTEWGS